MQTTQNTHDYKVALATHSMRHEQSHDRHQHDSHAHEMVDVSPLIQQLIREEAELRWRAEELAAQAHVLDGGDDESQMQADRLRSRRSEELVLADEMKSTAIELKNDPNKKVTRAKANGLTAQANHIISDGENEAEAATVVSATSTEHKAAVHHAIVREAKAEAKAEEKKEKREALKPILKKTTTKKPAVTTKVATPKQQSVQQPQHPPLAPRMWGLGLSTMGAAGISYSPGPCASTPMSEVPWMGMGLFSAPSTMATMGAKAITSQVVAAVKTVPLPASIGPLISVAPTGPLAPSALAMPWNQWLSSPTHS